MGRTANTVVVLFLNFYLLIIIKMRKTATDTIKVELQRFGESTQFVELPEDSTVEDLIEKADLPE